jgi:hypothetical protein
MTAEAFYLYDKAGVDTFNRLSGDGKPLTDWRDGYEYIFRKAGISPRTRPAGSSYRFFFGGTTSGKAVTERSAMQMTAVYSCVRILSEAIAGLPITCTDTAKTAARKKRPTIRSTSFCTMSQTRK